MSLKQSLPPLTCFSQVFGHSNEKSDQHRKKMCLIKIKHICYMKGIINEMKKPPMFWEKVFIA
jgi:hypothetical protein